MTSNSKTELERIAAMEAKIDRVETDIHAIFQNVSELKALANQGRGSLQTFLWIGGLVTGLVGLLGASAGFVFGVKP